MAGLARVAGDFGTNAQRLADLLVVDVGAEDSRIELQPLVLRNQLQAGLVVDIGLGTVGAVSLTEHDSVEAAAAVALGHGAVQQRAVGRLEHRTDLGRSLRERAPMTLPGRVRDRHGAHEGGGLGAIRDRLALMAQASLNAPVRHEPVLGIAEEGRAARAVHAAGQRIHAHGHHGQPVVALAPVVEQEHAAKPGQTGLFVRMRTQAQLLRPLALLDGVDVVGHWLGRAIELAGEAVLVVAQAGDRGQGEPIVVVAHAQRGAAQVLVVATREIVGDAVGHGVFEPAAGGQRLVVVAVADARYIQAQGDVHAVIRQVAQAQAQAALVQRVGIASQVGVFGVPVALNGGGGNAQKQILLVERHVQIGASLAQAVTSHRETRLATQLGIGLARHDVEHAAHGVTTVQRALGPAQHLHALDVEQLQIGGEGEMVQVGYIVHIQPDAGRIQPLADAPDGQQRRAAPLQIVQVANAAYQVARARDALLFRIGTAEHIDAGSHALVVLQHLLCRDLHVRQALFHGHLFGHLLRPYHGRRRGQPGQQGQRKRLHARAAVRSSGAPGFLLLHLFSSPHRLHINCEQFSINANCAQRTAAAKGQGTRQAESWCRLADFWRL